MLILWPIFSKNFHFSRILKRIKIDFIRVSMTHIAQSGPMRTHQLRSFQPSKFKISIFKRILQLAFRLNRQPCCSIFYTLFLDCFKIYLSSVFKGVHLSASEFLCRACSLLGTNLYQASSSILLRPLFRVELVARKIRVGSRKMGHIVNL